MTEEEEEKSINEHMAPCTVATCSDKWTLEWQDSDDAWKCVDCGVSCNDIHEYYMIHESLWLSVMKCLCGMLCIGCVESRLGRKLTPEDFTDCALNTEGFGYKSARLANRLNY